MLSERFFFLVEIHFGPLSASQSAKNLIKSVKDLVNEQALGLKSKVGFNMAVLRHFQNVMFNFNFTVDI